MSNEIERFRDALERSFDASRVVPEEHFTEVSPCGQYLMEVDGYTKADFSEHAVLARVVVRRVVNGELVATLKCNDLRLFHAWISRDGHDYLLCAEDLEGQTVIDLTDGKIAGFTSRDDGFIWAEFHPSPNQTRLAIVGCCWACPYEIVVYDFRSPLNLPLPVLGRFLLPENNASFDGWLSETSFRLINADGTLQELKVGVDKSR